MESDPTRCAVCGQSSEKEVLAERERCAQACEEWVSRHTFANSAQIELAQHLAAAIRSGK